MELPLQLTNAILAPDKKAGVNDRDILVKIIRQIKNEPRFCKLLKMMNAAGKNDEYKYIQAFDNCAKHIRLVPIKIIEVQLSFGQQPPSKFTIEAFVHDRKSYKEVNALEKIDKAEEFVRTTIYQMLLEIQNIISAKC